MIQEKTTSLIFCYVSLIVLQNMKFHKSFDNDTYQYFHFLSFGVLETEEDFQRMLKESFSPNKCSRKKFCSSELIKNRTSSETDVWRADWRFWTKNFFYSAQPKTNIFIKFQTSR